MQDTILCQCCGAAIPYGQAHDCPQKSVPPEIMEQRIQELESRLHQLEKVLTHLLNQQGENALNGYYFELQKIRDEVRGALNG
jgi:hypothetical protein